MGLASLLAFLVFVLLHSSLVAAGQSSGATSAQAAQALMREGKHREALPLLLAAHRSQPRNVELCHQIGVAYAQLGEFTEAARFYRLALDGNPRHFAARKNLGVVLWFSDRKPEAGQEFEQTLRARPDDPVAHFYLGMLSYERQQYSMARDHFRKAGSLATENPEAFATVLDTSLITKDEPLADQLWSAANKFGAAQPAVWFQAGSLFGRHGSYDRAIQAFERIRDRYPDQLLLMRNLGLAQLQARRYAEAVRSFEDIVARGGSSSEIYLLLAEACDRAGDPEKAYDAYARAIEKEPKSEEGYLALSNFAVAHHNAAFALQVLKQGLERIPASGQLLLQQGVVQALDDKIPQAEESFRQASQASPTWMLPWLALGLTQLQTANLAEAARSFQMAASLAKGDYRPYYLLALARVRSGGQNRPEERQEIVSTLRQALKLRADHADSHVLLGQTYLADNHVELAIAELEKALKLEPENTTALYQLGVAHRRKGKMAEAQEFLNRFEALKARQKEEEELSKKELVQMLKVVRSR